MKTALTIAGSDSGGGAGIQADLKTFEAHRVFGMSAITSITAQNTLGVRGVWDLPPEAVKGQLEAIFDDFPVDGIKIGMLSNAGIVDAVADILEERGEGIPTVLDPVMVSTSGDRLLAEEAIRGMISRLFPLATIITPNIREAEVLAGRNVTGRENLEEIARTLYALGPKAVLLTGGDDPNEEDEVVDFFYDGERVLLFKGERIRTRHTHGTGCTLSSAIAARLAGGADLEESVREAGNYVRQGLRHAPGFGKGHGPLRHGV